MSYDLFLKPKSGEFDPREFAKYFSARPNYKIDLPQVWYQNEETGVYFVIELQEEAEEGDEFYPITLNINYFRPSFFGLEAELEVSAFVRDLNLVVMDPQIDGMGEGEFVPELFISGWNKGNEFGYSAVLQDPEAKNGIFSLPKEKLLKSWVWNKGRSILQSKLGEAVFVPRILFLMIDNFPTTAMVWPDGIPIAFTEVDYFLIPRKELAPKRFFRKKEDTTLVSWVDALSIMQRHSTDQSQGTPVLNYISPPKEVQDFIKSLPTNELPISGVPSDNALDKEFVDRYAV